MLWALADVNNMYASCEQVFRPDLRGKPVIVVSNNDGSIIARNKESKALGIKMGAPLHLCGDIIRRYNVTVFSSQYTLYGDMSNRIMTLFADMAPAIEIYSIDECFLFFPAGLKQAREHGLNIKDTINTCTGLGICVGFGVTKTQAKLANHIAKTRPQMGGVFDLSVLNADEQTELMDGISIEEVWGVGRRYVERLGLMGIETVRQLRDANIEQIKTRFGSVLCRTVLELRGVSCFPLEANAPDKQQIMCSRSFAKEVTELNVLKSAVSHHLRRAMQKLRKQHSVAHGFVVMIRTNPFKPERPQHHASLTGMLPYPTDDTLVIQAYAMQVLKRLYRPGYGYKKAGIMLSEVQPKQIHQHDLFQPEIMQSPRRGALMSTMDQIARKFGTEKIKLGSELHRGWEMRRERLSPRYTTRWDELPKVGI
ncbi:Y-family DNA polymerase [Leeia oryzae]|uniref:Y-family DNA polymerase n=1 Tax=Leeia oryzae TaxID=356662 RepID=UPI0003702AE5|nr:Y-family DNA polymerase [Leeia oryzae]